MEEAQVMLKSTSPHMSRFNAESELVSLYVIVPMFHDVWIKIEPSVRKKIIIRSIPVELVTLLYTGG
jgi:hypothetical protein